MKRSPEAPACSGTGPPAVPPGATQSLANTGLRRDRSPATAATAHRTTIACGIVGALGLVAWYQEIHGQPIHMPVSTKQFAVALTTVGIFAYAIRAWRKSWRNTHFWIVLALLLVAYVPLQWLLVQYIPVNIITLAIVGMAELYALLFVLERLVPHEYRRSIDEKPWSTRNGSDVK